MKYLVLDLETGSKEVHGHKGNFRHNPIVAIGLKYGQDELPRYTKKYPHAFSFNVELDFNMSLKGWLESINIIVGHNIAFDLLHLWKYSALQDWILAGGRIWDTQYAEYCLSGQAHKYPSLRDIAVNKYGCPEREKKMEKYWGNGIDTQDIPRELVLEDVKNDVLDTEKIMLQQVRTAKKQGMFTLIMAEMDSILATVEMRYNGVFINQDIKERNQARLKIKIDSLESELQKLCEEYWK